MKKIAAFLAGALLLVTMAASWADATPFTVYGSDRPDKYVVAKLDPATGSGTFAPIVRVTSNPSDWVTGNWITYNEPDQSTTGNPQGVYLYMTAFNLTGLDPSTAFIHGTWASAGRGELLLNPTVADFADPQHRHIVSPDSPGPDSITEIEITDGYRSGWNLLAFLVYNETAGPTGLMVTIDTAEADPVPEPGTLVLLGAGLFGLAVFAKRRKNGRES